ncbi:MAG: hypothetical protein ACYTGH_08660 [Planctomycetota bacterium]
MNRLSVVILGFLLPLLSLQAADQSKSSLRLAVLDLQAPEASPWLGPAVAEAVSVKLAGVKGVTLIERERVEEAVAAARGAELTPKFLGADAILTGSIQVVGAFGSKAKLRISAKVVAADSAKLKGEAAFVLDGVGAELFALESKLATRFCQVLGREASALQLDYREEQNLKAKQLFAEGLAHLRASRGEGRDEELSQAVKAFRTAQKRNEGAFYARAHSYEGRARERLAAAQQDDAKAKAIREETVALFRNDAATAAPAFYDLGRALQANGEFAEATQAYRSYVTWMSERSKVIRWGINASGGKVAMPACFGTDVPILSQFDYIAGSKELLFQVQFHRVFAYSRKTHKQVWKANFKGVSKFPNYSLNYFTANEGVFAALRGETLNLFRTETGKRLFFVKLDLPIPDDFKGQRVISTSMVYLNGEDPKRVGVARKIHFRTGDAEPWSRRLVLAGVDVESGSVAWQKTFELGNVEKVERWLPQLYDDAFYLSGAEVPKGEAWISLRDGTLSQEKLSSQLAQHLGRQPQKPGVDWLFLPDGQGGIYLMQVDLVSRFTYPYGRSKIEEASGTIHHLASPTAVVKDTGRKTIVMPHWWGMHNGIHFSPRGHRTRRPGLDSIWRAGPLSAAVRSCRWCRRRIRMARN